MPPYVGEVIDHPAEVGAIRRIEAVPRILDALGRLTGMGFVAVARVTEDRWVACEVLDRIDFGLQPGGELKLETTICNEIRSHQQTVVIDHVAEDPAYADHHTPLLYGFQSYVSTPIRLPDGSFFGTLCAIDPAPRNVSRPDVVATFTLFADLIGFYLDADAKLARSQASLVEERNTAILREQFMAVLGHDLRNPIASINAGATLLAKEALSERARTVVDLMGASVRRMTGLVENILDFARARLGGGIVLNVGDVDVARVVDHVIAELASSHPGRTIEVDVVCPGMLRCDAHRLAQLLSNLVGNALTHGAADHPIRVSAVTHAAAFELSVANGGAEIPEAARPHLFAPFERGAVAPNREGLGLGLYIASQIAQAHGGTLSVTSSADETQFAFRMPLG